MRKTMLHTELALSSHALIPHPPVYWCLIDLQIPMWLCLSWPLVCSSSKTLWVLWVWLWLFLLFLSCVQNPGFFQYSFSYIFNQPFPAPSFLADASFNATNPPIFQIPPAQPKNPKWMSSWGRLNSSSVFSSSSSSALSRWTCSTSFTFSPDPVWKNRNNVNHKTKTFLSFSFLWHWISFSWNKSSNS